MRNLGEHPSRLFSNLPVPVEVFRQSLHHDTFNIHSCIINKRHATTGITEQAASTMSITPKREIILELEYDTGVYMQQLVFRPPKS